MRKVCLPHKLVYRKRSLNYLGNLWYDLKRTSEVKILIDFDNVKAMDCILLAALFSILYRLSERKEVIVKSNDMIYPLLKIEDNNYIFSVEGTIANSFKMLASFDEDGLKYYIRKFFKKIHINNNAFDTIYPYLLEVFLNVQQHTSSFECCISCCYNMKEQLLYIGIANIGETIKYVLAKQLCMEFSSEIDGLEWSVKSGNTTKRIDVLGGVGLSFVYNGLTQTSGSLNIISGKGWWKGEVKQLNTEIDTTFPGTVVILKINIIEIVKYNTSLAGQDENTISLAKIMEDIR